jgi:uncharacterized protein
MKKIAMSVLFAGLVVLGSESLARADGPEQAAKCRETGDHSTCAAAGIPLEASSPETALELYTAACAKQPGQCWALVGFAQRLLKKRDAVRAVQIWERGCEMKAPRACASLATEYEEGERGIPQDFVKAGRFHDKACELGAARSCLLLAVMVEDGRGARRDPAKAQKLKARADALEKAAPRPTAAAAEVAQDEAACRKNKDAARCLAAGAILQETDAVKAEEVFRLGCATDKATCGLWGFAVERFRRDDPSRATRILEEGCGQGNALPCVVLADLSHAGFKGMVRNEQRAAELYDKSCTLGDVGGCRATAARFRGVKQVPKADELREKAWTLEAEADKAALPLQEKWLKEAPLLSAREPFLKELERRRAEWRALALRARTRWDLRMQRLAAIDAGNAPAALPPSPATDGEASQARDAAIKRMAKSMFP